MLAMKKLVEFYSTYPRIVRQVKGHDA